MHREEIFAAGAFPAPAFAHNKSIDPILFNGENIFDHAHTVFCPVPFIQHLESFTGELAAGGEAEFFSRRFYFPAIFDETPNARLSFVIVGTIAADAVIYIALVRHTECAIHSTGSNEGSGDVCGWH